MALVQVISYRQRQKCVFINKSTSKTLPHGSILGPILFLIYVNDLPSSIENSKILLFADDAKLYRSINCNTDMTPLQLDIDLLYNWSICDLLCENRPFRHIWYFEKYHFETLKSLQFSCAVF